MALYTTNPDVCYLAFQFNWIHLGVFFVLLYICSIYCGPSIQLFNYSSDSLSLFLSFFCYWFWGVLFNQNQFLRIWFLPVNVLDSIEFWCLMSYFNDIPKYSLYMFIIQSANIVNNNFLSPLCMPYYVHCIVQWLNTLIFARTRTCKILLWLEFIYSSFKNKTQSTVTFWFSTRCFSFYCHILCTLYKIAKNIHTKKPTIQIITGLLFLFLFLSLPFKCLFFCKQKKDEEKKKTRNDANNKCFCHYSPNGKQYLYKNTDHSYREPAMNRMATKTIIAL